MSRISLIIPLIASILSSGCCRERINFIGLTREEVATIVAHGPRWEQEPDKNKIHVAFQYSMACPNVRWNWFFNDKNAFLQLPLAMSSLEWEVFFHLDPNLTWHSYLLIFDRQGKLGRVVKQRDIRVIYGFRYGTLF